MMGEDSNSWQKQDVFTGPAVERATRIAATVPAGTLARTAFSAYDIGDLIGIEGYSFIAKLPETVPPNPRIYLGMQWFIQGHATGPIEYGPRWADFYVEKTRCWLLDIAVFKNWFADEPSQDAIAFWRHKSLDASRFWGKGGTRLKVPPDYSLSPEDLFYLFAGSSEPAMKIAEDIPLAAWILVRHGVSYRDVPAVMATAPLTCVWFVRFQESFPGDHSSQET